MRRYLIAVMTAILAISITGLARAQEEPAPAEERPEGDRPTPADDGPEGEQPAPVKVTEDAPKKPERAISGEKVEINLRPGVMITGVVRAARIEVQRGPQYVKIDDTQMQGAGIRVYYVSGLNGYVFIPYDSIAKIRFLGRLSKDEGLEIARRVEEEQRRAEEEQVRARAALAEKKAAAKEARDAEAEAEAGEAGEADRGDLERQQKIRALLKRFPPETWKPERLDDLKRRAIVLDIYPNDEERVFMDSYDLWLEGYNLWKKINDAPPVETEPAPDREGRLTKPVPAR